MMVKFSVEELYSVMKNRNNIRNISVIPHFKRENPLFTEILRRKAGINQFAHGLTETTQDITNSSGNGRLEDNLDSNVVNLKEQDVGVTESATGPRSHSSSSSTDSDDSSYCDLGVEFEELKKSLAETGELKLEDKSMVAPIFTETNKENIVEVCRQDFKDYIKEEKTGQTVTTGKDRIKSSAIPLYFEMPNRDIVHIKGQTQREEKENGFLINLIDSFHYLDYSAEFKAAFRNADGALVVMDSVSGVSVETETVIRQAITERIKPVLILDNINSAAPTMGLSKEVFYQKLRNIVDAVNIIIATYPDETAPMGGLKIDPAKGNVAFGSGSEGWAFTLKQFAEFHADKLEMDSKELMSKLWGDKFFNRITKQWSEKKIDGYERAFNYFVLDPILKVSDVILESNDVEVANQLIEFGIQLNDDDHKNKKGQELLEIVMQKWWPAEEALLQMFIIHLPSPVTAQRYRVELLYDGSLDDEAAVAIKNCDPNGPLMMSVFKLVPSANNRGKTYAFGRVFSGCLETGQKVHIHYPTYVPGTKIGSYPIKKTVLMMGEMATVVQGVACGNVCGIAGVGRFLPHSGIGTITDLKSAHSFKVIKCDCHECSPDSISE